MQMDKDMNASISILHKATTIGYGESHARGEGARPQIEAVLAELRTYPANAGRANGLQPLEDVMNSSSSTVA